MFPTVHVTIYDKHEPSHMKWYDATTMSNAITPPSGDDKQGPIVPSGWRPTASEPVPVVRCTTIKKNGERCKRWSLRGVSVCVAHGGRLPNVQEHAAAVVEGAKLRLIGLTDLAIDQLEDLVRNGSAEKIRLDAARDILDRAGAKGAVEINVEVTQTETAADRVRAKLLETARRLEKAGEKNYQSHIENADESTDDIIDALIEDEDE